MAFWKRLSHDFMSLLSPTKEAYNDSVIEGAGDDDMFEDEYEDPKGHDTLTHSRKRKRGLGINITNKRLVLRRESDSDISEHTADDDARFSNDGSSAPDDLHDASTLLDERLFSLATDDRSPATHSNSFDQLDSGAPRIITGPESLGQAHLSTAALEAAGYDADYITLLHRIILRGFEPLLPSSMHFPFKFLPDELFSSDDDPRPPFITSSDQGAFHAEKYFSRLMELSSRVRDLLEVSSHSTFPRAPERLIKKEITRYFDFLYRDAGLSKQNSIPIVVVIAGGAGVPAAMLRERARHKCARVAQRWRVALQAHRQAHPMEDDEDELKIPTLYALIASHSIVALMAYQPLPLDTPDPLHHVKEEHNDDENESEDQNGGEGTQPECTGMAIFDLSDRNNDVWDALALACVGCHARNVAVRYRRATGIGEANELDKMQMDD